jgi:hypothetical protein
MRNLDNHRYIGEAIQLLQNKGEKVKVPFWFKALDVLISVSIALIPIITLIWLVKKKLS